MSRRLLIVSPTTGRGGAEEYMLMMGRAGIAAGWQVTISLDDRPETREVIASAKAIPGAKFVRAGISDDLRRGAVLRQALETARLLGSVKPDVVMVVLHWPTAGLGCILASAIRAVPTAVVFQLAPWPVSVRRWREPLRWASQRRQTWISVSRQNRDALGATFGRPVSEFRVIYNGVAPAPRLDAQELSKCRAAVREDLGLGPEARIVLTIGRLHAQKGYLDLLAVLPGVLNGRQAPCFVWVGEGDLRAELESRIDGMGLSDCVRLVGHRLDSNRLLQASDLFLLPSQFEGHPLALMEAMSHGIPAVTSDAGGSAEVLRHEVDGLVHRRGDQADLARRLAWALDHPDLMKKMSESALMRAHAFSREHMIQETFALLDELVGR